MPFKSEAQRRWMHANQPEMAHEWESHTSKKRRKNMPYKIEKQYYERQRRTNPVRATEAAVGVTMVGYGASRSGIVRDRIARGQKQGPSAWDSAERARRATEHYTGNLERAVGRTKSGRKLAQTVPRGLRPTVAGIAGALMIGHAQPVRQTTYRPAGW